MESPNMKLKRLTTMAMLTAVSMIIFLVEAQIPLPIPIPGVKLGVANVITLFALWSRGHPVDPGGAGEYGGGEL